MDQFKSVISASLLLLAIATHGASANQPLQQAKNELNNYQSSLQKIGTEVQTIDLRIKSYENKITGAKQDIETARQDLESARSALIQAKHDKSAEAARKIELAQKTYDISQLGYENRQKRLSRLERKISQLAENKEDLLNRSRKTESQIQAQKRKVARLRKQSPTPAPKKELAAKPPAPAVKPTPIAPPISLVEDIDSLEQNSEVKPSPIQTAKLEQPIQTVAPAKVEAKVDGSEHQRKYAKQQMALLRKLTTGSPDQSEWNKYQGLKLKVARRSAEEFEFLGNHQYYIETNLENGSVKLKIGSKLYSAYIRSPGTYVIIYDVRNKRDPAFSLFKKSWSQ